MIAVDGVEMCDVQEAARIAGRTPETIRRWVWSGKVDSIKSGNKILIPRAQLSTRAPRSDDAPLTLADWMARHDGAQRSRRGASAADLVLHDREGRSGAGR